ncbi:hypothetical protein C3B44_03295 [Corynebacterium yudongzhengii]|uniref:Uncharacterized protein n=1 Tax=Corynebacterium yudongzhengii TaxID=2080740 RepID=A0A2U1T7F1_9CORY|nr:hypothetical protein [Corynebacterium yudongzhengii]AWB81498.1 hypothetical protein C3B44_03295 [Corynebacterium yudongzhengii]PWC01931.1 hypothetical protein DF222_04950 [Corynebacterium yudongzhengii]
MGFWDRLFGHDHAEPAEDTTEPEEVARYAPTPEPEPEPEAEPGESIAERIRRTPPRPMPGFSSAAAARGEVGVEKQKDKAGPQPERSTAEDERVLANAVATLATAGITPRRELTLDDVSTGCSSGLSGFHARPLTSTMKLVDADGEFLFRHVHFDVEDRARTSGRGLADYAIELGEAAGSPVRVRVVPDPGSSARGSIRVDNGNRVRDVSFDLDADFGDQQAEDALTCAVAAPGRRAYPILTDAQGERLTAWVTRSTPEAFFTALHGENPHTCR